MATTDSVLRALGREPAREKEVVQEEHVSDAAMIEGMQMGDPEALGAIYDRYSGMVYPMVLGVLRDHAGAEEVLRDLFVQLWHSAAGFDSSSGSLPAWLMVMGRHRALARLRQPLAQGRCEELKTYPGNSISSPFEMEQERQIRVVMETLRSAMEELPPQDRQTLELAYLQGLSESELARRTGECGDFVRTRLLSAMNVLIETYGRTRQV